MKVIVIGGGGHAKVVIDTLRLQGADVVGIIDKALDCPAAQMMRVPVLGDDNALDRYLSNDVFVAIGVGGTNPDDHNLRRELFERARAVGHKICTLIHPSAVIGSYVALGVGAQIMAGALIQPGCRIGANTIINTGSSIDHDCLIGDHVHVAPGAVLSGGVTIEDGAHVGTGAKIIEMITVGARSMVAAGAVVVRNTPPNTLVKGSPAK